MREEEFARVLWVRAIEESDDEGDLVRLRARDRATLEARSAHPDEGNKGSHEAFLVARADGILEALAASKPGLAHAHETVLRLPPLGIFAGLGVVLGLTAEMLGSARAINLLAVPLVGLVGWNLALYLFSLLRTLGVVRGTVPDSLRRALGWLRLRAARAAGGGRRTAAAPAVTRFAALWTQDGARPSLRRLRARLHLGGAGFGLGAIAGLYLAGFSFDYQATWESTFLGAEGAARFLGWILAPGALLLGTEVPEAVTMSVIRAPESGEAAPWIHLWSATLFVVVVAPRLLLAALALTGARAGARRMRADVDDAYFTRVLAKRERSGRRVELVPYSTEVGRRAGAIARELAIELFGGGIDFIVREPTPYGSPYDASATPPEVTILVFNLAQTPEREVQGVFVEEWIEQRRPGADARLLVLLDAERYAATAEPERLEERERAWQRVLREAGTSGVLFAATEGLESSTLDAAAAQLAAKSEATP